MNAVIRFCLHVAAGLVSVTGVTGVTTAASAAPAAAAGPGAAAATSTPAPASSCSARSSTTAPTVVELYTSEGCSSCPPADRWLSTLKGRPDVIALAFHVSYWDYLGWRDRFADPAFTQRQRQRMAASGSRVVYTPQVVVNGRDWRSWPSLPKADSSARPTLTLRREGDKVVADVGAAPGRVAGYFARIEDGHASQVRSGENAGEKLRHDHVVRRYEALPAWDATAPRQLVWQAPAVADGTPGRVVFVLTDPATEQPIQALALSC